MGKFDLDKLKVKSFVTSLNTSDKKTVAGGLATDAYDCATDNCSEVEGCDMTNDFENCGGGGSGAHCGDTEIANEYCAPTEAYYCG